jgi:hypothetical protein
MTGIVINMNKTSIERIKELFLYYPETGVLCRKCDCGKAREGQVLISETICVDGIWIRSTHIMWALHHGSWPPDGYWIDHKDGVKAHNWLINLRLATPTQNQQNKAGSGQYAKGVTWRDRINKPWQAKIRVNGTRIHLGSFRTQEEASKAYKQAALEYHGEFACLE